MKISQRLQTINHMVTGQYDHIWDCCCDHGLLGMLLLEKQAAPQIHFVDSAAPLMYSLEQQLTRFFPRLEDTNSAPTKMKSNNRFSQWHVHCVDAADLPLHSADKSAKHLIIIAGVGGELLVEIVQAIMAKHGSLSLEFILCPVHHNYYVRQSLAALGLKLRCEHLLQENRRFYEILHVYTANHVTDVTDVTGLVSAANSISSTGTSLWQGLDSDKQRQAQQYLQQLLAHYQKIPLQQLPQKSQIVADYQAALAIVNAQHLV